MSNYTIHNCRNKCGRKTFSTQYTRGIFWLKKDISYLPPPLLKMKFVLLSQVATHCFSNPMWPFCLKFIPILHLFTLSLPLFSFSFPFLPVSFRFLLQSFNTVGHVLRLYCQPSHLDGTMFPRYAGGRPAKKRQQRMIATRPALHKDPTRIQCPDLYSFQSAIRTHSVTQTTKTSKSPQESN
jgi:hypothetical protein